MKDDAVATLVPAEKQQLQAVLDAQPVGPTPIAGKPRALVQKWKLDELTPTLAEGLKGRDFERGRRLFGEANCFTCHRFSGEGGAQGPDLTGAGGRFNPRDLLESVLVPSKEVSDQYQAIVIEKKDGKIVTGRIVNYNNDTMIVMTNMLDPNGLTTIKTGEVEAIERSTTSMMPEGLLDVLSKDEVLDLMAYLLSRGDKAHAMFAK
jgi:putative heme-binding domain-containing protein